VGSGGSLCVGYFDYGKGSNTDFEFFLTAQNNFVGRAGQEINIHYIHTLVPNSLHIYIYMANRILLTG
jgi:hypothetical protein